MSSRKIRSCCLGVVGLFLLFFTIIKIPLTYLDYQENEWINNSYQVNSTIINKYISIESHKIIKRSKTEIDYVLYFKLKYSNSYYDIVAYYSKNLDDTTNKEREYNINSSLVVYYNPIFNDIKLYVTYRNIIFNFVVYISCLSLYLTIYLINGIHDNNKYIELKDNLELNIVK